MEANITQLDDRSIPPMDPHLDFMNSHEPEMEDNYKHEPEQYKKHYLPEFQEYIQKQPQQQPQQPIYHMNSATKDIFTDLDKSVYVIIFVAFILGFFMGKTMQPVILRPM
jgi:hypothetical protein